MTKIQEKEAERPGWSSLPEAQRTEEERGFQHMSMLARYLYNFHDNDVH